MKNVAFPFLLDLSAFLSLFQAIEDVFNINALFVASGQPLFCSAVFEKLPLMDKLRNKIKDREKMYVRVLKKTLKSKPISNLLSKGFLLVIIVGAFGGTLNAQNAQKEANLKAAFIYNFTKYIDWGGYDRDSIFVIGVAGDSPIVESLDAIAESRRINDKRVVVKTITSGAEIADCDIVFISKNCRMPLKYILEKTRPGELTISEHTGYADAGTALNFVVVDNRLKFEANLEAISSAGLKAGSQLLKLAIIVHKN